MEREEAEAEPFDWREFNRRLPTHDNAPSEEMRKKLFRTCDVNDNGLGAATATHAL